MIRNTHVVGSSRANWTLCGIRVTDNRALPYTLARYVRHKRATHTFCAECVQEDDANSATKIPRPDPAREQPRERDQPDEQE